MLLDTRALSPFANGRSHTGSRHQSVRTDVVLGEYRLGIIQSRRQAFYESWLAALLLQCEILSVDAVTAVNYAAIRDERKQKARPIPANDIWIAALARQYDLPILTRDHHYDAVPGVRRVTW